MAPSSPPSTPEIASRLAHEAQASRACGTALFRSNDMAGPLLRSPQRQQVQNANRAPQGQRPPRHFMAPTKSIRLKKGTKSALHFQGESIGPGQTPSRRLHRPSTFPQQPDVSALSVSCDPSAEYAILISMYEVYNDRIFDLLTPPIKSTATKEYRRRPLLFKPTEGSPDRKAVAGLRKVICGNLHQALMVLEAGLHERRVAGTGSNSVSSRSHGFFCVEVKKRTKDNRRHGGQVPWGGSALTVVDLAGSERARDAKTAGTTLAEAGKINESLMYLGQCLQMQSDAANKDKVSVVPANANTGQTFSDQCPAQPCPFPAVQTDRVALFQLIPLFLGVLDREAPQPTKGRPDRDGRPPRRLQRDIPNSPIQRSRPRSHCPPRPEHHPNHPHPRFAGSNTTVHQPD